MEEEIAAIKAELGKSVKGKRRSRPTRAASSRGGSSLQEEILQFMKGKDWMAPVELLKGLKVSPDPGERTTVRNALRYLWSKKMVKRKKVGTMPNGHPRFAYRLA